MALERDQLLQDVRGHPVTFIPGKRSLSRMSGDWPSPFPGKGYEPMSYRDFEIGDDPRRVNLAASARRSKLTIVERIALSEFIILIVIDDSDSMRVRRKWDTQMAAALLLLYSAWKAETTFGIAIRNTSGLRSLGLGLGSRHFHRLEGILWDLLDNNIAGIPKGRQQPISRCMPVNSMMLFCSDFLDERGNPTSMDSLLHAIRRYDFVPVIIQDELEFTFPSIPTRTAVPFSNPETGLERDSWISPEISASIRTAHERRFQGLTRSFMERNAPAIHLSTPDVSGMRRRIDAHFRRRHGT